MLLPLAPPPAMLVVFSPAVTLPCCLCPPPCFYRQRPFTPVIRSVNDRFTIEVRIPTSDANRSSATSAAPPAFPSPPKSVFLILSSPSLFPAVKHNVYSYHQFTWTLTDKQGKPVNLSSNPPSTQDDAASTTNLTTTTTQLKPTSDSSRSSTSASSSSSTIVDSSSANSNSSEARRGEAAVGKQLSSSCEWKGSIDFGVFSRCGFFDWRVVRANEEDGSWSVSGYRRRQCVRRRGEGEEGATVWNNALSL